jgi:hypothetical protein
VVGQNGQRGQSRTEGVSGVIAVVGQFGPRGQSCRFILLPLRIQANVLVRGGLIGRLREYRSSIRQATNLDVADFDFTVLAMAVDLVAWGEAVLIRHFQPLWCSVISGFGIHAPGKGRGAQMRSMWDEIHPGRSFAEQLPANPVIVGSLQTQVGQHCQNLAVRLGCPVE